MNIRISDEKWLRKASGRAKQVQLFTYGGRAVPIWWKQNEKALERYKNLKVWNIPEEAVKQMGDLVTRNMELQYNISDGEIWLSSERGSVQFTPEILKA